MKTVQHGAWTMYKATANGGAGRKPRVWSQDLRWDASLHSQTGQSLTNGAEKLGFDIQKNGI